MNIIIIKFFKLTMSVEDITNTLSRINLSFNNLEYYNNILGSLIFIKEWKFDECYPGYSFSSLGRMKLKIEKYNKHICLLNKFYTLTDVSRYCGSKISNVMLLLLFISLISSDKLIRSSLNLE